MRPVFARGRGACTEAAAVNPEAVANEKAVKARAGLSMVPGAVVLYGRADYAFGHVRGRRRRRAQTPDGADARRRRRQTAQTPDGADARRRRRQTAQTPEGADA